MSKDFYKNPIFIKVGILVVTAIILFSLVWLIYSKDQPKIVPPETRGKIREGIKEEIVKPVKSVFPGVGESLSYAEYKPSTTTNKITSDDSVSNSETSDWQTYRNTEIGFSLKYPETYTLENINNVISITPKEDSEIGVWIYGYKTNESLDSWWRKEKQKYGANFTESKNTINGINILTAEITEGLIEKHYILSLNGNIIDILLIGPKNLEKIINTLKQD